MENIDHSNGISEAIPKIKSLGSEYDPDSTLSLEDQLLACESLIESTPVNPDDWDGSTFLQLKESYKRSVNGNGSVNDSYKRQENAEETQKKLQVISELTRCNYRTTPKLIASLLEQIFSSNKSKDGHWLWIAQRYTPKSINSVIAHMQKIHSTGADSIQNPSAYFTEAIKYHPKRTLFRANKRIVI